MEKIRPEQNQRHRPVPADATRRAGLVHQRARQMDRRDESQKRPGHSRIVGKKRYHFTIRKNGQKRRFPYRRARIPRHGKIFRLFANGKRKTHAGNRNRQLLFSARIRKDASVYGTHFRTKKGTGNLPGKCERKILYRRRQENLLPQRSRRAGNRQKTPQNIGTGYPVRLCEIIHVQTHPVAAFHGQNLSDEYANRDEKPDLLFAIQRIYDPGCLLCKNRP